MPVNPDAVGAKGEPRRASWTSDDAILYALGIGAGVTDPVGYELEFTTDNTAGVQQRVFPTMVVLFGFTAAGGRSAMSQAGTYDPRMLVHGEQGISLFREMPIAGEVETLDEIVGVYDKGKGAVIATKTTGTLVADGEPLYEATASVFITGEGGFGGDRGPSGKANVAPDRAPDHEVTMQTRPDQALLYRLCGDKNPLHSDKQFSDVGGFPKPILHGLCTYGFTGRALLHTLCGSDPARFTGMDARFSSPVLPGEALTVRMWEDGPGRAIFQTLGGDGRVVIDNGGLTYN
ncbi:MAG: MaoC/PaaZ C-terminal domain-containing protein [Acidimicrobiia bacterium]|nr:MaoC/PaaZ C-terminal domain-containing protein [Acidimicrobiia bacterium]MDH4364355.1 MaoC/PaaZ C-terminal domain-containing protein [Acidimicrobiia bacterium]MDH5290378.1 MaoC/PaaZ C-terminal domain-containing protein [Acidimicrobiia bacterium]